MADENSWMADMSADVPDEDKLRIALRQQRVAQSMQLVPEADRAYGRYDRLRYDTARIGAALGNAVSEKMGGEPPIPDEMQNKIAAIRETKQNFEAWAKDPSNKDADSNARAMQWQKYAVESAFKNNLPAIGIKALRDLQDRQDSLAKAAGEREKLGYENEYAKATLKARIYKTQFDAKKGGQVEVYPIGSTDPNVGQVGFLNFGDPEKPDGSVTLADGVELRPNAYTFDRPQRPPQASSGRGDGGGVLITPTGADKVRLQMLAAMKFNTGVVDTLHLLDEAAKEGVTASGWLGKITNFTNQITTFSEQLAGSMSPTGTASLTVTHDDGSKTDLSSASARAQYARANFKDIKKWLPKQYQDESAVGAQKLAAIMVDLTYAQAMTHEGGSSRSLSDHDFDQAGRSLGMHLNNPDAMRNILLDSAMRSHGAVEDTLSMFGEEDRNKIASGAGFSRYQESVGAITQERDALTARQAARQAAEEAKIIASVGPDGGPPRDLPRGKFVDWARAHPAEYAAWSAKRNAAAGAK